MAYMTADHLLPSVSRTKRKLKGDRAFAVAAPSGMICP